MKNKYLGLFFFCLLMAIPLSGSHAKNRLSDEITITVPQNVILDMIKAVLPIPLEKGSYFKGELWIQAIDHLTIGSDTLVFDMGIKGKNIQLETRLGNKTLWVDIGDLDTVFNCRVSLRYDAAQRLLYITPHLLQKPGETSENTIVASLLGLLSIANGIEYPIDVPGIQPFIARISGEQLNIQMDITDIHTEKEKVFIRGRPKIQKIE